MREYVKSRLLPLARAHAAVIQRHTTFMQWHVRAVVAPLMISWGTEMPWRPTLGSLSALMSQILMFHPVTVIGAILKATENKMVSNTSISDILTVLHDVHVYTHTGEDSDNYAEGQDSCSEC